jgi:iron(III) transport system permease protein
VLLTVVAADGLLERVGLNLPGAVATGSMLVLVYAYAVRFLAPGLAAIESGVEQVPEEMTASARSLGASPIRTVARVHLPLSRSALLSAAVLVGVDALKELPIVLLLRPFGYEVPAGCAARAVDHRGGRDPRDHAVSAARASCTGGRDGAPC